MLLLLCLLLGCRGQAWNTDCQVGRSQDRRSSALLYAHRCNLKDVPIAVPPPDNVIPDLILPSHIVVPRCQGGDVIVIIIVIISDIIVLF